MLQARTQLKVHWLGRVHNALDAVMRLLAFYVVPLAIAIMSLIALVFWNTHYINDSERPVALRVLTEQHGLGRKGIRGNSGALFYRSAIVPGGSLKAAYQGARGWKRSALSLVK